MNREDILRMAREAWGEGKEYCFTGPEYWHEVEDMFQHFATLVAAAEREECANFLERGVDMAGLAGEPVMQKYTVELLLGCAAAIRARSNQ